MIWYLFPLDRQSTLATLKYTANERAGGWDTVVVSTGRQRGEIPLYIIRKAGGAIFFVVPVGLRRGVVDSWAKLISCQLYNSVVVS